MAASSLQCNRRRVRASHRRHDSTVRDHASFSRLVELESSAVTRTSFNSARAKVRADRSRRCPAYRLCEGTYGHARREYRIRSSMDTMSGLGCAELRTSRWP